jgi:hypothetical protein
MADSTPPSRSVPARQPLDRTALERVLARASELQAGTGDRGDELTDEQIVELGKEVGLAPEHLRQALAEERTRLAMSPEPRGLGARLYGEARLSASRTVSGTPRDILRQLEAWMSEEECLTVKRHFEERVVWEPQRGLLSSMKRAFNMGARSYALAQAHEVAATVVPVDGNRVLVRLDADFSSARSEVTQGSVAVSAFGVAATTGLAIFGAVVPIALPVIAMVGIAAAPTVVLGSASYLVGKRVLAKHLTRGQLALEQLLDRLARGELARQPSLLSALAAAAANLPRNRF